MTTNTTTNTSPVIEAFVDTWSRALQDADRARLIEPLAGVMAGTATSPETDDELAWMAMDWLVRVNAPAWLRAAGLTKQANELASLPELTEASTPGALATLTAARAAAWEAANGSRRHLGYRR